MSDLFQSPHRPNISRHDVLTSIKEFISESPGSYYKLTIGSDSEIKINGKARKLEVITAVVIYRIGYGGRYFWSKTISDKTKSLRDKIYEEVLLSIETAKNLVPELKTQLMEFESCYDLEIHIDVGESGATRDMIKEVVGIVTGSGYIARTKPHSYAASNIADRHA